MNQLQKRYFTIVTIFKLILLSTIIWALIAAIIVAAGVRIHLALLWLYINAVWVVYLLLSVIIFKLIAIYASKREAHDNSSDLSQ